MDHDEAPIRGTFGRVPAPIWVFVVGALIVATWMENAGYDEELQIVHEDDGMVEFVSSEGEVLAIQDVTPGTRPDPWFPIEVAGGVGLLVFGVGLAFVWHYAGQVRDHD